MATRMRIGRVRTGESLWRLATRCGVSQSVLSLLERQERGVDRERAERIAEALGKPLGELLYEREGAWWALLEGDDAPARSGADEATGRLPASEARRT
jgi:transcriptional regulator with XRE-family HTH domain